MADTRSAVSLSYVLDIQGTGPVALAGFQGGDAIGDVIEVTDPADPFVRKHLGGFHYAPLDVTIAIGSSQPLLPWINEALAGNATARNGTISAVALDGRELWGIELTNAMITDVWFAGLDGASKEVTTLGLRLAPESARQRRNAAVMGSRPLGRPKSGLASNFRLTIDGLDAQAVVNVQPPTVHITVAPAGPAQVAVSNLVVTVTEMKTTSPWWEWHEEFVVDGRGQVRDGRLDYLAGDLRSTLLGLVLRNLGIVGLTRLPDTGDIARLRAELYCEQVELAL